MSGKLNRSLDLRIMTLTVACDFLWLGLLLSFGCSNRMLIKFRRFENYRSLLWNLERDWIVRLLDFVGMTCEFNVVVNNYYIRLKTEQCVSGVCASVHHISKLILIPNSNKNFSDIVIIFDLTQLIHVCYIICSCYFLFHKILANNCPFKNLRYILNTAKMWMFKEKDRRITECRSQSYVKKTSQ